MIGSLGFDGAAGNASRSLIRNRSQLKHRFTLTRAIHDRMPVIFDPRDVDRRLTGEIGPDALKPAQDDALRLLKVMSRWRRRGR